MAPEGSPFRPLYDDSIKFNGQPIALVVADDWETAKFAATLVRVEYQQQASATDLEAERGNAAEMDKPHQPRGDAAAALVRAAVRHEADYVVPTEHHNPMELYASTVVWEGDGRLTVYDKTQGVQNVHKYLCSVFDKKPEDIRVLSPYVGGAFGSGLRPQYQVVLATLAALALKRSVRVVLTRQQMYGLGYRPMTIERVALGAKPDGTLDFRATTPAGPNSSTKARTPGFRTNSSTSTSPPHAICAHPARLRASARSNAPWMSWRPRSSSTRSSCA